MKKNEIRTMDIQKCKVEIRASEDGTKRTLVGLIPYETKSVVLTERGINVPFIETIRNTAFKRTVNNKTDVKALWNHNDSFILGRVGNGTLQLEDTAEGLRASVELPNTSYANDLFEVINRQDVSTMSFGFQMVKDTWDYQSKPAKRSLDEVKLLEVSFGVTSPAYPDTDSMAAMRSLDETRAIDIESLSNLLLAKENDENYVLSEEDLKLVQDTIEQLQELVPEKEPEPDAPPVDAPVDAPLEENSNTDPTIVTRSLDDFYKELELYTI